MRMLLIVSTLVLSSCSSFNSQSDGFKFLAEADASQPKGLTVSRSSNGAYLVVQDHDAYAEPIFYELDSDEAYELACNDMGGTIHVNPDIGPIHFDGIFCMVD